MSWLRIGLLAIVLSAFGAVAQEQPYAVVAGEHAGCGITPIALEARREWVYRGSGGGVTTPTVTVAAGPNGRVLAVERTDDSFEIRSIRPFGSSSWIASGLPEYKVVLSMVAGRDGSIFVLARQDYAWNAPPPVVIAFDSAGNITRVQPLDLQRATSIDLADDQCTLWIAAEDRVSRFDLCTSTRLSDFVIPPPLMYVTTLVYDVAVLPDGGAVVLEHKTLRRYDADGTLVQSYPVEMYWNGRSAVALAEGGTRAVVTGQCTETLYEIDLNSGSTVKIGEHFIRSPSSVVPRASWTAALGSATHRRRPSRHAAD
jgi:hypothetical protein